MSARERIGGLAAGALALGLAACAEPRGHDAFSATGEVIAMGGGDAGAARACFTCHGLEGQGDGQAAPRLAGLPAGYLQKQLEDYAAGLRPHPLMRQVSKALGPADRRRVAEYYASMPVPPAAAGDDRGAPGRSASRLYHQGDPSRGLASCASCHGDDGGGRGPANPPLAGQPADYLAGQLSQWRRGERRNDGLGVMGAISRRLTPGEVEALARYASALAPPAAPPSSPPAASP